MILELYPSTFINIILISFLLGVVYVFSMFINNKENSFNFFTPFKSLKLDKLFFFIFTPILKILDYFFLV